MPNPVPRSAKPPVVAVPRTRPMSSVVAVPPRIAKVTVEAAARSPVRVIWIWCRPPSAIAPALVDCHATTVEGAVPSRRNLTVCQPLALPPAASVSKARTLNW